MLPKPEINFQRTPVTLIIAAVAVALELVSFIDPDHREFFASTCRLGMLSPIWSGELWRPFTSCILHGSPIHVAFNAYWVLIFGSALEPRFGSLRYLGLFVLLGYVSMMPEFLLSNLDTPLDEQAGGVGLSGIVYGLFGLLWMGRRWRPEFEAVCNNDTVNLLIAWFFICIVLTRLEMLRIANIAHGAGAIFGVLYGLALYDTRLRKRWIAAAGAATLLVLATVIACPGHPLYEKKMRKRERIRQWHRQFQTQVFDYRPAPPDATRPDAVRDDCSADL